MSEPNIPSKFEVPVFPPFAAFSVPTTKILAIGSLNTSKPAEEIAEVLPYEVRQTVALHLDRLGIPILRRPSRPHGTREKSMGDWA